MTALCGGGSSSPKDGVTLVIDIASSGLIQLLTGNKYQWLARAASFFPLGSISLGTFCASDPPAQPTFTTDEVNAIIGLEFGSTFDSGIAKFVDLVKNLLWYQFCKCDAGPPPTQPAPQTQPTGSGTAVTSITPRCSQDRIFDNTIAATANTYRAQNFAIFTSSFWDPVTLVPLAGPPASVHFNMRINMTGYVGVAGNWTIKVAWFNSSAEFLNQEFTLVDAQVRDFSLPVPAGATGFNMYSKWQTGATGNPVEVAYCECLPNTTNVIQPC